MRLSIKYLLSCLALLFLLPACKTTEEVEEATLALSAETLTFAKESSEQTVTVSTNKDSWMAFSPQEASWITLRQEGNTLYIQAEANEHGRERLGAVIVSAGGAQRRITIRQTAADIVLQPEVTHLSFFRDGGRKVVHFKANTSDFQIELAPGAEWLTVEGKSRDSFTLVAKATTEKLLRTTKVTLVSGNAVQELTVEQEGSLPYVLPLLAFPAPLGEVMKYEQERGHIMVRVPDGFSSNASYRFMTRSKLIPYIEYQYSQDNDAVYYATRTQCTDIALVKDNPDFEAFLLQYGFTRDHEEKAGKVIVYTKKDFPALLSVVFGTDDATIRTAYLAIQDKAYPTFTQLPMYRQASFLGSRPLGILGASQEEIRNQEKSWKSSLDTKISEPGYDRFIPASTTGDREAELLRGYFYTTAGGDIPAGDRYIDHAQGLQVAYADLSLAFWRDPVGKLHLTREVMEFMAAAGFPFYGSFPGGNEAFFNKKTGKAYIFTPVKEGGKHILEVQCYYDKPSADATAFGRSLARHLARHKR